jgi:translation elongation factor P/translation initiation factor 5A
MATTSDIRNGMVIEHKGRRMKIISFLHVKPGKGVHSFERN